MTQEELLARIEKKEKDIEKIQKELQNGQKEWNKKRLIL